MNLRKTLFLTGLLATVLTTQRTQPSLHQDIFSHENVVVLFSRPSCPYCHKVFPLWNAIQAEFPEVKFIYIGNASNVDKQRYNFRTVPTFMYFKNGQRITSHGSNNGTLTLDQLRSTIKSTFNLKK